MKKYIAIVLIVTGAVLLSGHKARDKPVRYAEYTVQRGDTLDSISRKITPNDKDYRYTVYDIADQNGIEDCVIYTGQTINVPVWEE